MKPISIITVCKDCGHKMHFVPADKAGVYLASTECTDCESKNIVFQSEFEQPSGSERKVDG